MDFHHTRTVYEPDELTNGVFLQRAEAHHTCEVFLLLAGSVQYIIEGQAHQVNPMDMIIIKPGEVHAMHIDGTQPYERMVLHFAPDLFPSFSDLDLFTPFSAAKTFAHIVPKSYVEKYRLSERMQDIKDVCAKSYDLFHALFFAPRSSILDAANFLTQLMGSFMNRSMATVLLSTAKTPSRKE